MTTTTDGLGGGNNNDNNNNDGDNDNTDGNDDNDDVLLPLTLYSIHNHQLPVTTWTFFKPGSVTTRAPHAPH